LTVNEPVADQIPGAPATFAFGRERRLLVPAEFKQVLDHAAERAVHPNFLLLAVPNTLGRSRIGFVLPKRRVRHAVERNRVKRIIREAFRHLPPDYPPLDIVVMARDGLPGLDAAALRTAAEQQLAALARRHARAAAVPPAS
jgi:ribonuclease P protein component